MSGQAAVLNVGRGYTAASAVAPTVTSVSAGYLHSAFVKSDGTLWTMGRNVSGQLGDGTTTDRSSPVQVATGVASVAAGDWFTLFVKTDGTLWAVGSNLYGQLGDGTETDRSIPVQVATGVALVAAGGDHAMFVKTNGTLWGMGYNVDGELGDGSMVSRAFPEQVASGVVTVAAGYSHTAFVKTDGTLWTTGLNSYGALGDGTATGRFSPVQVTYGVASVAAGWGHTMFLMTNGALWAMGNNGDGELGNGTTKSSGFPVQAATGVASFAAGDFYSMFVKTDGTLWGMGGNEYGELGTGGTTSSWFPVQVFTGVASVAAGGAHTLFVKTDGTLWGMGYNGYGQLGDGTTKDRGNPFQLLTGFSVVTTAGATAFTEGNNVTSTPVAVDPALTVSSGASTLASGTVSINGNLQSGDVLAFRNDGATMGNIFGSYFSGAGVLVLTSAGATATLAQWQAALRSITYTTTSESPNTATRTVTFVVNDGTANSAAGTKAVSVAAVNDTPTDITLSGNSISHSTGINATVGTLSTTDLDSTSFTYTLVGGSGSTDNASCNIVGATLSVNNAAMLAVGTYSVRIQTDDGSGGTFAKVFTFTVTKGVSTLTWSRPADIIYGVGLSVAQLNATANVPGTLVYNPAAGRVLNAGSNQTLNVTFTPTDAANYTTANTTQSLTVRPAPLIAQADDKIKALGAANPNLTISYAGFVNGDTVAAITEPAISSTATAASVAGLYPITLTGGNAPNYTLTLANGTLGVATKIVPALTWPSPAAITYGTVLGSAQLNATSGGVAGTISYAPAAGAVLSAGTQTLNATFTPMDIATYAPANATQSLPVNQAPLTARADDKSKAEGVANPTLTISYAGFLNGDTVASITEPAISTTATTVSVAGSYPITLTGGIAPNYLFTLQNGTLTVTPNSYLSNLSVRAAMAAGQTLIVGFVVNGGAKPMLVRAAGPVLNRYGLTGVVDPSLTVYTGAGALVSQNDNWDASLATTFARLGAFAFDAASKDAALQQTINGPHTAQATATGAGAILVEAYDAGPNDTRKLVNLSARFQVGTGDNILIAGFVLSGNGTRQVLIRAVGPTLASYGVTGTLADPQFTVFDAGGTVIATNDNWSSSLTPTFDTVGAFHLIDASKDAAMVVTLQAGKSYTVQVSGVGGTIGEALIEIYLLP